MHHQLLRILGHDFSLIVYVKPVIKYSLISCVCVESDCTGGVELMTCLGLRSMCQN